METVEVGPSTKIKEEYLAIERATNTSERQTLQEPVTLVVHLRGVAAVELAHVDHVDAGVLPLHLLLDGRPLLGGLRHQAAELFELVGVAWRHFEARLEDVGVV